MIHSEVIETDKGKVYVLCLDEYEAKVLKMILGSISGNPISFVRKNSDSIWTSLKELGLDFKLEADRRDHWSMNKFSQLKKEDFDVSV